MANYRPAVFVDDNPIKKIVAYIPAEIVTAYLAFVAYLSVPASGTIPEGYQMYYKIVLGLILIITPVWTYFAIYDSNSTKPDKNKRAVFHAIIATVAIVIWIYALGNPILKSIICKEYPKDCKAYSNQLGAVFLVAFTLITPLLERIILGTALPFILKLLNKKKE